jgi:hypothetical protein
LRALVWLILAGLAAAPARAERLELTGQAGVLGEWELTATVAEAAPGGAKEFAGPLTMTHVGICTQDGPEQKSGEMRLQLFASAARMTATLRIDGLDCAYSGRLTDAYTGTMTCPDRRPQPLTLWVKAAPAAEQASAP